MPLARCIVDDGSKLRTYYPLKVVVKLEGNKKPDTMEAIFTAQNRVREGYPISFIEDVTDITYLRAVYPMQLSCLDEGGFDQDPSTDPLASHFTNVTSGKYEGLYALEFTADGQGVAVTTVDKINISKQFDIHIWFTPDETQLQDGSDEPTLWSFEGGGKGLNIGIEGTNGDLPSWKVMIKTDSSTTGLTKYTGSDTGLIMTEHPVHIRVKRDQNNLIKAYVNGKEQISVTVTGDMQPTSTDMIFGDTDGTDDEYSGLIHEVKVYCGSDLTDNQADMIRWTKPVISYMKFAGKIRKLTSNQTQRKAICQSNSYELTKAKLGDDGDPLEFDLTSENIDFTGGSLTLEVGKKCVGDSSGAFGFVTSLTSSSAGTITLERRNATNFTNGEGLNEQEGVPPVAGSNTWTGTYTANTQVVTKTYEEIAQEAVDNAVLGTFKLRVLDPWAQIIDGARAEGDIIEIGSVIEYLKVLLLFGEMIMYVTPRRNIIVETASGVSPPSGKVTPAIFDQGGDVVRYNIRNNVADDSKLINSAILTGNTGSTNQEFSFTPNDNIRRTLRRNILQLNGDPALLEFARLTVKDLGNFGGADIGEARKKIIIQTIAPIHHVKFNSVVHIIRKDGDNANVIPSEDFDIDDDFVVTQMEYHYPSGKTIVRVGENDIDFFDDRVETGRISDGLIDTTL